MEEEPSTGAAAQQLSSNPLKYGVDPSEGWQIEENDHPIEEVRLTVNPTDNPNLPVLTFRTWLLGVSSCVLLSFTNTFFGYRTNQLGVGSVCIQIISLPIGRFLAASLPEKNIRLPFTKWSFSLNPGPFSIKEHCLISIFAGTGAGSPWGVAIVTIVHAFYHRGINLMAAFLLVQTTQGNGINVITEYIIGLILPGKPLANVAFKTYGTISMGSALYLLSDLNLGHYMKIPPKAMFISQLAGTIINSTISFAAAWLLLNSITHICDPNKLPPGSPWTCPGYDVFYNASIIWGLVGPMRMFGKLGHYSALNLLFLVGIVLPIPFWFLSKAFPRYKWLKYIHIPLLLSGGSGVPPIHAVNYTMWGAVGIFFNCYIYKRHKNWWARHTYVMSAALDAGVAFMGVLIFFAVQLNKNIGINWWGGVANDYCPLASCPTAPGVMVEGCPIIK
ncbi:hypothetical protein HPP92_020608 [Vanilla planifolia]|uniref:Oligopeptide transporter n=1 Tax=Vanilla planifolia TaxID=51239 RepID=A0A835Q2N4_VANPL|nr:hypothetical protein HPP92_020608 [Vanilla planifolia]